MQRPCGVSHLLSHKYNLIQGHKMVQFLIKRFIVLIFVVHFVLFNTVWGLRTRACGENPRAAETAGINVYVVRYVNVISSGAGDR